MTLTDELTNDPLGRNYAAMTDAEVAADLNEKRYPALTVSVQAVDAYFDNNLLRFGLKLLRDNEQADATARAAADTALDLRNASYDSIRVDVAAPMLDILVASGALTAQHKAELLALGNNQHSRAEALGLGVVRYWDVARARG